MKFQTKALLTGFVAGSALAVAAAPAQAFNFTTGEAVGTCGGIEYTDGLKSCTTADGFTLTVTEDGQVGSLGGYLSSKTVNGITAVGVYGDPSPAHGTLEEIDYGEEITATLPAAKIIESIDLAFLYQPGEFGDVVYEVAEIVTAYGSGFLKVTGDTTAEWTFGGVTQVLTALSPSLDGNKDEVGGGGLYRIVNPFGDLAVSSIAFNSVNLNGTTSDNYRQSDYSIAGIEAAGVPEPSLMVGLGAVGSLLLASRRRRPA